MPKNLKFNRAKVETQSRAITLNAEAEVDKIRTEELMGAEHLVVPIVALVEGVIQASNAANPELALASEFGRFPSSWNGRPITLGHPERDGINVSASSSPEVFEEETLGFIFNAKIEDEKLKVEAWINKETLNNAAQETQDEIARLEGGELVEVSTGLFTLVEGAKGRFNGKDFNGVWRDVVPDHLAILPEGVLGACSVAAGCGGPRTNKAKAAKLNNDTECKCNGECEECKEKTPKANNTTEDVIEETDNKTQITFLKAFSDVFKGLFSFKSNKSLSDVDKRMALDAALTAQEEDAWSVDIVALFDDSFVYSKNWDFPLLQRSYSISDNGEVTLGSDAMQVRPVTEFVPINIKEATNMSKKELIEGLIANEATQFTEDDRKWLEEQDEDLLDKLQPVEAAEEEKPAAVKSDDDETVEEIAANKAKPVTAEEYLSQAPDEIREVLNSGLKMHTQRKTDLVKALKENDKCLFSEDELRSMEISQLEKLAKLARTPNFEGQAGDTPVTNSSDDKITAAPRVFEAKKSADAA